MVLTFDKVRRTSVAESIYQQIMDAIRSGRLQAGDKLHAERELMRQFHASRASVREALRALAMARAIDVRPGSGAYVNSLSMASVLDYETLSVLLQRTAIKGLAEVRWMLEVGVAKLAAERATAVEVANLEQAVTKMQHAADMGNLPAFAEADFAFHEAVMQAAHNEAAAKIQQIFRQLLARTFQRTAGVPESLQRTTACHRAVCVAIMKRDATGAARATEELLDLSGRLLDISFKLEDQELGPIPPLR